MSFQSQDVKDMLVISMPHELEKENIETFKTNMEEWNKKQVKAYILDFKQTEYIAKPFYQALSEFNNTASESSKKLFSLNLNNTLTSEVQSEGMNQIFNPVKDLKEITLDSGKEKNSTIKPNISVDFINPFLKGVQHTLKTQTNTDLEMGKPYLQTEVFPNTAIAGLIYLTGSGFQGNIALRFPKDVFLNIYENMLGEKHEEINNDIQDAASELLNIIYGAAKSELNEKGYQLDQAIPKVLIGEELKNSLFSNERTIVMPFSTKAGKFCLEVETIENQQKRSA